MKQTIILILLAALGLVFWAGCGEEMTPPRNQIPAIKKVVYALQERVKARDRAAIDSLLSAKILDNKQSGDSLLSFVYGPTGDFAFEQFGSCDIAYTREIAEASCFVMDSTHAKDRPIRLSFIKDDTLWLLTAFGGWDADSLAGDTAIGVQ